MRLVYVAALKSFETFQAGELYWVYMTQRVASLIVDDYLRLMWDPYWTHGDSEDLPPGGES